MNRKQITWAYHGLILYTVAPILCVILASLIATATGSQLNEGSANPCIVFGVDIGGFLYSLFVMGWLMLVTIPTGIIGIIALSITLMIVKRTPKKEGQNEKKSEGLAVASIILSAMSLMIGPFGAIPGIACGIAAKKRIARSPELSGKGLAQAGIIIGAIGMLIYVVLMVIQYVCTY